MTSRPFSLQDQTLMQQAVALHQAGKIEQARTLYLRLATAHPSDPDVLRLLATAETRLGNLEEGARLFGQSLRVFPNQPGVHYDLGSVLQSLGRFEEAIASYDNAIALHPGVADVWCDRGIALRQLKQFEEAAAAFRRALKINPGLGLARINLARTYDRLGQTDLALRIWSEIAKAPAGSIEVSQRRVALNRLARIFEDLRDDDSAEDALRQSLALDPGQREVAQSLVNARQRQCSWPVIAPFEGVSREALLDGISPLAACAYTDDPLFQLAVNRRRSLVNEASDEEVSPSFSVNPSTRLRIGYLSSDLREHPIGHLLYEVPVLHDRAKVEVFIYYCGPKAADRLHEHYRTAADHFIDIAGLDDVSAAQRIRDDSVQILVDVNGYTQHSRQKMLAMKPAPVIVNWLGFPGSMASRHHHYIVADDWIIPPENEAFYSEKVLRLSCYQPNNRHRIVADRKPARAEAGLPQNAFVFCCFNGSQKISQPTFERWLEILRRVQGSVLWLLAAPEPTEARLRTYAQERGVAPSRIIFADYQPNAQHLARYPLADLFLDTAPYGAHTTCSDALWMGVPVITLSGRSFASRVCGSLVRQAGLPELVFIKPQDYVDHAVAIAQDPARLAGYRARLEAGRDTCALFDTPALAKRLEDLYAQMWAAWESEALPTPDLRNLDAHFAAGPDRDQDTPDVGA